jgi:putative toxin-antitoxin system antitoxin component (TIGR02293 family)
MWHNVYMATIAAVAEFSSPDLTRVERGIPLEELNAFVAESGLGWPSIYETIIPSRTLKHRKARNEALSLDESDRFARFVRLYQFAVKVFGEQERAVRWLTKPKQRFDERTPIQMLRTELGGRLVEEMLGQIEHGMFA